MAALLASLSAIAFGVGDFLGGLSARRMAAVATAFTTQAVGLVLVVAVAPLLGGSPDTGDLLWGAAAGIVGPAALVVFYRSLSAGQMSVVAPISAVTSATVPLLFGLADGERPGIVALMGALAALPAILLVSRSPEDPRGPGERDDPPRASTSMGVLVGSIAAGVGFGSYFVLISRSGHSSGLWPLVSARVVAVAAVAAVLLVARRRSGRSFRADGIRIGLGAGAFDVGANSLFLLASRHGMLTLVGVIGSMYPASTVVLARVVLAERLARHQLVGLALAVGSLVAVTVG